MKKNVFLKLASALLVLCLASTCAIGTTFAKYTTADKASDTARVAKWGITVAVSGTLFGTDYASNTAADAVKDRITAATSTSVSSLDGKKIVAPGTKNDTGFQVKLSGQPEVAYKITADTNDVTIEDIWLAANTYGVMVPVYGVNAATDLANLYVFDGTTYKPATAYDEPQYFALHDKVVLAAKYNPIQWSVSNSGLDSVAIAAGDLMAVTNALVSAMNGKTGNAEDTLEATYTLTWEWPWEVNNGADTILGNLQAVAAGESIRVVKLDGGSNYVAVEASDYNLDIAFGMKVIVDQVN